MRNLCKLKPLLPLATAVAVAAIATPALAQVRTGTLEEVIVTAQKRQERYLDVPVSVNTLSGETLDMAKVSEFQDLVQVSPSLTYNQSGDQRGVGILIRGIGTTAFQTSVEPTVSTVIDGITMGRTVQFVSDLNDVERVEILRGPQGTLFGKNASAGLIHIITKKPTDAFEASVQASATDDDAYSISATVSGGLSDAVRGRLSAYSKDFDGFIDNRFTGETVNGDESWGVRGKLDIDLSETVNLYLIGDYSEQDRDCCAFLIGATDNRFYQWDYAQYNGTLNDSNDFIIEEKDGFSNTETFGLSAELTADFENFRLVSITGYREFEMESNQGVDVLPYAEPAFGRFLFFSNGAYDGLLKGGNQEQTQFSQEFRIETTGWDRLNLTAGLFYWDQDVDRYFERITNLCVVPAGADTGLSPDPAQTPCLFSLYGRGYFESSVETENWAAFGQVDWNFAERWVATAGFRYTEDDISVDFQRITETPGPAVAPSDGASTGTDEDDFSGKLALRFDATEELMVYGSYATGYKSPAFDLIFGATAERIEDPVPPETSEAWELGIKGELFDNRLRLGLTLFHTTFDDLQGQATPPDGIGFQLVSAGKAETKGVELDFTAKPWPSLLLNGGIAYTDATFDEYRRAQCYPNQSEAQGCRDGVQDLSGKQIPNAPKWKYTLQARYDMVLPASFDAFFSGTYRWQDDSPGQLNHDPRSERRAYGVLDLIAGLEADDGRWSAHVFVKNALDDYYVDLKAGFSLSGGTLHYLNRDAWRYTGVQVEYNFGAL